MKTEKVVQWTRELLIADVDRYPQGSPREIEGEALVKGFDQYVKAHAELLRDLKSAVFYIETYGGEVTANFAAGGNLDAVKAVIARAERGQE